MAAGAPPWCVCNFTWLDIYADYVVKLPRYLEMFQRMLADYALADPHIPIFLFMQGGGLCIPGPRGFRACGPCVPGLRVHSPCGSAVEPVGMVCRPGRQRREDFARRFGLDPERNGA